MSGKNTDATTLADEAVGRIEPIQGLPPVDEGTVVYTIGVLNYAERVALNFGGVCVLCAFAEDGGVGVFTFGGVEPTFAANYGFGETGSVEVVFANETFDRFYSVYFIGDGTIQALHVADDAVDTLARDLPTPTSLVVSRGDYSVLVERSGRVSYYEHPQDEVDRRLEEAPSRLAEEIAFLFPQITDRLLFGGHCCQVNNGYDAWSFAA